MRFERSGEHKQIPRRTGMVNLSPLSAEVRCMSRRCPSCESEKTTPWMGGTAAGRSRTVYHCENCGYFGPIFSQTAAREDSNVGSTFALKDQEPITIVFS